VTRLIRTTLAKVAVHRPWQASTMRLSTRIIGPYPTLARQALFNAPSATRNCKYDETMASETFIQNALNGTDMLRVS
jgi:alpha-D-ribose 1-methylphosphonate 5-triphosphate synthase subunit PhnI